MKFKFLILSIFLQLILASNCFAQDWPMWRHDAGRTAASSVNLNHELNLHWVQNFNARVPVWDDPLNQDLMQYDTVFEPVVLGKTLYVGFNDCDKVAAFDLVTGNLKWEFYTDGPVRLPLAGWNNKIYFTSDDGNLYCLSAENGQLLWKFDGGPTNQKY